MSGPGPSFREALVVWARIGLLSFGGPAGQIALMHRILVDEKKWIGEGQFLHALNFCMLLPGPEAQQLATYVGWLLHRTKGAVAAGFLFIMPGLGVILALSTIYVLWREIPAVSGIFFGLQAAVLALVLEAVQRVARRAIKTKFLLFLGAMSFVAIAVFRLPFPLIVAAAALIGWGVGIWRSDLIESKRPAADPDVLPSEGSGVKRVLILLLVFGVIWAGPVLLAALWFGPTHVFTQIGIFFSKMAIVTFGGAYAVLAYVGQQAVEVFGWLNAEEMLHGLGLAETTPGPLILVLTFVGFLAGFRDSGVEPPLLGGMLGGLLATWVTFAPCFLWIMLGAPYVERARHVRAFSHALAAITASVVGVILNLAVWFALHANFSVMKPWQFGPVHIDLPVLSSLDPTMLALSGLFVLAVFRWHLGLAWILGGGAVLGMLARLLLPG